MSPKDQASNSKSCAETLKSRKLATRVREFRRQKDMTQDEVASFVGVKRETINRLENGNYHNPTLILAHCLASLFDTTIDELFIFDEK